MRYGLPRRTLVLIVLGRGVDSIDNTTDEQVRGMEAAFGKALSDLHASLKLQLRR